MDHLFSLEQIQSLPDGFKIKALEEDVIFVDQDVSKEGDLKKNFIYNEEYFDKKDEKKISYVFLKTRNSHLFTLDRAHMPGYFSGTTNERIETQRAYFELWKHLNIENEQTELLNHYLNALNQVNLPLKWDGFVLKKYWNPLKLIDLVSKQELILPLYQYESLTDRIYCSMRSKGRIFVNHEYVGDNILDLPDYMKVEINKCRLNSLFV